MKDDIIKRVLDTSNEQFEWVSGVCTLTDTLTDTRNEAERFFGRVPSDDAILIAAAIQRLECTLATIGDILAAAGGVEQQS